MKLVIPPDSTELMASIIEELNGPKFVNCRLLCFEVKLSDGDQAFNLDTLVPVVLKYEKTLKSINDYLNQVVKTGSISLLFVENSNSDRSLYTQLVELFKDTLSVEVQELLSREYSDNLLPKPSSPELKSPQADSTKTSSHSTKASIKDTPIKKDAGKSQATSKQSTTGPKDGKGKGPAISHASPGQATKKPVMTSTSAEDKDSATIASQPEILEEYTFHDMLNEVLVGSLSVATALSSQLISDKPDLKEVLAPIANQPQKLSLRYHNSHKLKCHNCGKPNYHTCKVASGNSNRLAQLFKVLKEGKVSEYPGASVTLSILINDDNVLSLLEKRAFSEDGGRGIQLKSNIDINYCLETMQKKEDMGKDSLVDCSKCGKKTEREVCYIIEKAPKLFLIQLKRFKTDVDYKTGTVEKRKVCTMIELRENIAIKDQEFELYGVVNHYGEIDKGHYTACVKRPSDGQWFLYDDEKVTKITFKDVNSEGAYLLFYQEKTV